MLLNISLRLLVLLLCRFRRLMARLRLRLTVFVLLLRISMCDSEGGVRILFLATSSIECFHVERL